MRSRGWRGGLRGRGGGLTLPFHIGIRYGPLTQTACNMRGNTGRELYILSSGVNQTHDGQGQRWEPVILAQGPGCLAGVSVGDTRGGGHASKPRGSVACDRARYTLSHGRRFLQAPLGGRGRFHAWHGTYELGSDPNCVAAPQRLQEML